MFNRSDAEVDRYRHENRHQTRLQVKATMTGQTFFALVSTFFAVTPAIIYVVAGYLVSGDASVLTAGTIVAFTTLQARLQMPLMQLMRVTLDVQTSLALFRRLFEYLDLEPAIHDRPSAVTLDVGSLRGDIELRDVWFRYPPPRTSENDAPRGRDGRRGRPGTDTAPPVAATAAEQTVPEQTGAEQSVAAVAAATDERQGERVFAAQDALAGDGPSADETPSANEAPPELHQPEELGDEPGWALRGVSLRVGSGRSR